MSDSNWTKSSYSYSNGDCVEWREWHGMIQVRDSRNPDAILAMDGSTWGRFLDRVKNDYEV